MVLAPSLSVGTAVELSKTEDATIPSTQEPVVVVVKSDGGLLIENEKVSPDNLLVELAAVANNDFKKRIYLRGNDNSDFKNVMKVMHLLTSAGYSNIALITPPSTTE